MIPSLPVRRSAQSGSVLFYILIAVALFAALGYAVSNMMRGNGDVGSERAGVYASEIMSYANALKETVRALRISNGCDETDISFERIPFDGSDPDYVNATSPADFSCHVFHPDGGGLAYNDNYDGNDWRFTYEFYVDEVGTAAPELSAVLNVSLQICEDINNKLSIALSGLLATMDDGANGSNVLPSFTGSYSGTSGELLNPEYNGQQTGCYQADNAPSDEYTFYQVLIPR